MWRRDNKRIGNSKSILGIVLTNFAKMSMITSEFCGVINQRECRKIVSL